MKTAARLVLWCAAWLVLAPASGASAAGRYALLIGISDYTYDITDLEGPRNDVEALRKALVGQWGFAERDVRVLLDGEASRDGILAAIDSLKSGTHPGDFIFLYYSGHGTSSFELSDIGLDGNTGALVPADMKMDAPDLRAGLVIGNRDLRPRLEELDRDRQMFVLFDSCYSGAAVRSLRALGRPRYVSFPTRGLAATFEDDSAEFGSQTADTSPFPYSNLLYISAASKSEAARDVTAGDIAARRATTVDGLAHGALTDAVLEALSGSADTDRDGVLTYEELYQRVRDRVSEKFPQQPQLLAPETASKGFRVAPVLGATATQAAAPRPAPPPPPAARHTLAVRTEKLPPALGSRVFAIPGIERARTGHDVLVARESTGFRLYHGSGDLLCSLGSTEEDQVVARLQAELAVRELIDLTYPDQDFNVTVDIPGNRGFLTRGDSFGIEFRSDKPASILLLNIDNSGHVGVLYPFEAAELTPTRSGSFGAPDELKVSPPFGTEYLKIFAFAQRPPGFETWVGRDFSPLDPELGALLRMLREAKGSRAQARLKVVTLESGS